MWAMRCYSKLLHICSNKGCLYHYRVQILLHHFQVTKVAKFFQTTYFTRDTPIYKTKQYTIFLGNLGINPSHKNKPQIFSGRSPKKPIVPKRSYVTQKFLGQGRSHEHIKRALEVLSPCIIKTRIKKIQSPLPFIIQIELELDDPSIFQTRAKPNNQPEKTTNNEIIRPFKSVNIIILDNDMEI